MPKPFQHAHAVHAHSWHESAWSDIFKLDATTIRQHQPLPPTTTATTPISDNTFIDAPVPTINDTIIPPPLPALITATNTKFSTTTTSIVTSDYLLPSKPPPPKCQRWGFGTNLPSLRSLIYLANRPGLSHANPSHRDWQLPGTPWDPSQVEVHAQGRLRSRQTPAPSPESGLLDSVMAPGSGRSGEESAVYAAQVYYHFELKHAQVTVPAARFHVAYGGHRQITTVELICV
ncbi:unnamed protein product [Schistocephalus solidus]|uniref:SUN domain-containing protein n=1 Tax=Schistocephalus solidus TaxID=70667 RepID=A0A183SZB5_SCHSO|nr:unnamed protein product [Schistocephalus solidus]